MSVYPPGTPSVSVYRLTKPDNTNADPDTRAVWVTLAQKLNVPIRCVLFTASSKLCEHNDTFRALNIGPEVSFVAFIHLVGNFGKEHFQSPQAYYYTTLMRNVRDGTFTIAMDIPIRIRRRAHADIQSPPRRIENLALSYHMSHSVASLHDTASLSCRKDS